MTTKTVEICNKVGLHARPAALLIEKAKQYQSVVHVQKGEKSCTLSSIIALLQLQVKMGDRLTITTDGPDEAEAMDAVVGLIESGFGES